MVKMLVEAGSDVVGDGDDYGVGVLGWATCLSRLREPDKGEPWATSIRS